MPEVVVVGAGIVGASVAYHAARLGAAVTVVDMALPGSGVTGDSFAWIGSSGAGPGPALALRRTATQEYRRLETELPSVRVRWLGSVSWWEALVPGSDASAELGPDQRLIDSAEVAALEPNLRHAPPVAVHSPGDGAVDPVGVTGALVQGARNHDADVLLGAPATSLRTERGQIVGVETSAGFLPATTVVLAAGVNVPALCTPLGVDVPVAPSPALLLRFAATGGLVKTLVSSPSVEAREDLNGDLLAAVDYHGEASQDELAQTAQRTLTSIASMFRGAENIQLQSARIGMRPMPGDGEPIIGYVPGVRGLYVAMMHSGVTFAAIVGRLVAEEVVNGVHAVELQGCRLARFTTSVT